MHLSTLQDWLARILLLNPKQIELSLERVKTLVTRLDLSPQAHVITVGGTNGKGSTVAALEAIYLAGGYHTGAFTSPVLFEHNEQVRIDGQKVSDAKFIAAFEQIEAIRGDISLTPFEFHTIAAFLILGTQELDVWILEVGLGGRLDAVNVLDADVSIVTSISIDHVEWLGDTREKIGFEKAGIFRAGRAAICGDLNPPQSLLDVAQMRQAQLYLQGKDFSYTENEQSWDWQGAGIWYNNLPKPVYALTNMAAALMAIQTLADSLPVTRQAIDVGLQKVHVPGRIQVIPGVVTEIYDVSHNEASVSLLAAKLTQMKVKGKMIAVFSMLDDKDIAACVSIIAPNIEKWYVAELNTPRAASIEKIKAVFQQLTIPINVAPSIKVALNCARENSIAGDCIVVFGSFHTIAESH